MSGMNELHAYDALAAPNVSRLDRSAFRDDSFSPDETAAMRRHVKLVEELRQCRYFTEQERSLNVTMDAGVTMSSEMTLPDAGATRDMLGVLRQIFGDKERASLASITAILRFRTDPNSTEGQALLHVLALFEQAKQGVLDSWDAQPGGADTSPYPPLTVFLDWMYGEYLHSDAEKAKRIEELNHFRMYEWQFHWVADRLAVLFDRYGRLVKLALDTLQEDAKFA